MGLKITSISVKGFRAFRRLEVQGLGHVNLITGRNNTGKSSLLEALRLLAWNAAPMAIRSILSEREEYLDLDKLDEDGLTEEAERLFFTISSLFNGFPQVSEDPDSIVIATKGESHPMKLMLNLAWVFEERDYQGNLRLVPQQKDLLGEEDECDLALIVRTEDKSQVITRLGKRHYGYPQSRIWGDLTAKPRMSSIFVGPYGGEGTTKLAQLWDRIALSEGEEHVVQALKIIDPHISAVSMVGEGHRRFRTAIVRADNIDRPVPLRSFGDGLNRLFGIILSLVNAKNGLLLIDEFENGLHHTVQYDVWRTVFKLAKSLNIQVFATSHSWDAVEAFQRAAAETPEEGALIRLTRKEDDIIPTVFTEDELAIVARDRIEVR